MTKERGNFRLLDWPVVAQSESGQCFVDLKLEEIGSGRNTSDDSKSFQDFRFKNLSNSIKEIDRCEQATIDLKADVKIKEEQEYERGLKEGENRGIELGKEIARKEYEGRFVILEQKILDSLALFTKTAEKEAVSFALEVAKKILLTEIEIRPDYIVAIIRHGLQYVGVGEIRRIRLSEPDFEFMRVVGFPFDISSNTLGIDYVADDQQKGGCVIETNFGEIDLRIDEMWAQLRQQILGDTD